MVNSRERIVNMKAIILAAGLGSRLGAMTKSRPKCMIEIDGKTILQRMTDIFKAYGIAEVVVVRGYKKDLINYSGLRYCDNTNFENTSNLASLFCAEGEMDDEFIVSFADLVFDEIILEKQMQEKCDISLVIDINWLPKYEGRTLHPISEADKVIINGNKIVKIGKNVGAEEAHGEFIGMGKFSKKGGEILRTIYHQSKTINNGGPFHEAESFRMGHIMDIIQEAIDQGYVVAPVMTRDWWSEIDTPEDYKNVIENIKEGKK